MSEKYRRKKTNTTCVSKVLSHHKPPKQASLCRVGIDCTSLWKCTGQNTVLPKEFRSGPKPCQQKKINAPTA